jgi:hypothetical protein
MYSTSWTVSKGQIAEEDSYYKGRDEERLEEFKAPWTYDLDQSWFMFQNNLLRFEATPSYFQEAQLTGCLFAQWWCQLLFSSVREEV